MSLRWPSTLASLDESLADLDTSLQQLEAARTIDLARVLERLKEAAESSRQLRTMVLSDLPHADWQDRGELDALLAVRAALGRRASLLALANELEYGTISHRRAARVTQLKQLREKAVDELRALASAEEPQALPGPDATHWINWASGLKEPEDTAALQSLRAGFSRLDEFVAALEPGMWTVPVEAEPESPAQAAAGGVLAANEVEQRRTRLLALAAELERGEVVHHRAMRVSQVNQLREQAIQELRFQAVVARAPAILPGPDAEQWVQWASALKEPEDSDALQHLREGFVHLDEFVANLEPGMWVSSSSAKRSEVAEPAQAAEPGQEQPVRRQATEPPPVSPASAEPRKSTPAVDTVIAVAEDGSHGFAIRLKSALAALSGGKLRIVVPTVVLLLAVLGAMQWRLHRTSAGSPAKAAEVAAPDTAANTAVAGNSNPSTTPASATTRAPEPSQKTAKLKDVSEASKPVATPPQKPEAAELTGVLLRTPQAMPKTAEVAKSEEPNNPADAPGALPGAVPGGVPNSVSNFVKQVPAANYKLPAEKLRVSSGVAQGQLIHQVTPTYPQQAKLSGVRGTVVLQAVVGKDGAVKNVRAVSGPPMLVQSALDAVKQWRYKPFAVNGEPAEADIEVNVNFNP